MRLASYLATRPGVQGIANRCIRARFGGKFFKDGTASHTEVVFMPGDGVDHLMPDGTCEPNAAGEYWCASSVAREKMPEHSPKRKGRNGGVRFKRIKVDDSVKWEVREYNRDPLQAALWFKEHEGDCYDWYMALGFFIWIFQLIFPQKERHWACSQSAAAAGGYPRPDFFHPELMRSLVS